MFCNTYIFPQLDSSPGDLRLRVALACEVYKSMCPSHTSLVVVSPGMIMYACQCTYVLYRFM